MTGWTVVLPVKAAVRAKSRLARGPELARAIALDTIEAVGACGTVGQVVVVTDDAELEASLPPGARMVADRARVGPNAAILKVMAGLAASAPRAALLADLPALRSPDLAAALEAATMVERAVVPDAEGTGSTLVTAAAGAAWASAFGANSFARHLELGCVALEVPAYSSLRRDVDTAEHLAAAEVLGLGRWTSASLRPAGAPAGR
ncbi:2-phospho-L-lactate guanylyltransferase [Microbacterium sp. BK668]|uniref:2-phospho-L-lactate guanylyltransferase n=1 Tax=Microbacterium sp. BK668 TaxID=2512118 RepID=UPI0010602BFE|nr:2-phospho-L-lactate guanylyltransferase [Microbacterium sp. BK668]TDN91796.1 2-phospho-L-lactate guanylyltransferase [Microbacterium sp. BK668]